MVRAGQGRGATGLRGCGCGAPTGRLQTVPGTTAHVILAAREPRARQPHALRAAPTRWSPRQPGPGASRGPRPARRPHPGPRPAPGRPDRRGSVGTFPVLSGWGRAGQVLTHFVNRETEAPGARSPPLQKLPLPVLCNACSCPLRLPVTTEMSPPQRVFLNILPISSPLHNYRFV